MKLLFEDKEKLINLFEIYQKVLTEKQIKYFTLYYFNDLSLKEISDNFNISKNAISDSINKTCQKLINLEDNLNLSKLINENFKLKEILKQNKIPFNLKNED